MKMVTSELIVLEKSEKDVVCKDGVTRHYFNVKLGSSDYENITFSVKEDVYNALDKEDKVIFQGRFGGLAKPFWGIDAIVRLNGKDFKA